jgi:phosphonate transport system substrate-binding protein
MIRRSRATPLLALGAAALVGLAGCGRSSDTGSSGGAAHTARPSTLAFSVLSAEDQASYEPLWTPLLNDLSKAIGMPVKPFFSSNYTALVQAMRFNQVQLGWFSAEPALETIDRASGQVFARTADLRGQDTYTSVILVRRGSGLTLDRILKCDRTLSFGMGDPKSTSGTLAPEAYLFKPKKIDPNTCFKVVRSATHAANLFSVANGVLDASTNNSVGLDFASEGAAEAKRAFQNVQVVWSSPPLPESAIVYRKDLDPALREKIRSFFLNYGKAPGGEGERQKAIMAKLHYSSFNPADDSYLQPIRDMRAATAPGG